MMVPQVRIFEQAGAFIAWASPTVLTGESSLYLYVE
jgi:hypothetical protein